MSRRNFGKIFAVLGVVSGLGNAVRFPAMCMEYGACFMLVYAVVLAAVAFPLLGAEFCFGIYGGRSGKFGRAVGCAAAVNSALIALCCGFPSLSLCLYSLSYIAEGGGTALKVWCALAVWGSVFALVLSGEKGLAKTAHITVTMPAVFFLVIAVRSCGEGGYIIEIGTSSLSRGGIWADALGQAVLSLSLAAGVMPTFAKGLGKGVRPFRLAAAVAAVNFVGGVSAAAVVLPYAGKCAFGSGLSVALSAYSDVIALSFGSGAAGRAFGFLFFLSLAFVAVQSCASLALPLVGGRSYKCKAAFCAVGFMLTPLFCADGGAVYGAIDRAACTLNAPAIAFFECLSYARLFPRPKAKAGLYFLSAVFGAFALFSMCGARVFAFPFPLSLLSCASFFIVLLSGVAACRGFRAGTYLRKISKLIDDKS